MKKNILNALLLSTIFIIPTAFTKDINDHDNQWELRTKRNYASNFKDMVLASCVGQAYKFDEKVVKDTNGSAGALFLMWVGDVGYEAFPDIDALIIKFLKRKYEFHEIDDLQGNMMKCLDLYHSRELDKLVKKHVPKPNMTLNKDQ